jgi:hypothetical protein
MRRCVLGILPFLLLFSCNESAAQDSGSRLHNDRWNKTTVIKDLPFGALLFRDFYDREDRSRELYVLTEPESVTELNLHLLFGVLAEAVPQSESLQVWVYTDVEQLSALATGQQGTVALSREQSEEFERDRSKGGNNKAVKQLAYYRRFKEVEFYRYNPEYPKPGHKTVMIRGKED